MRLFSPRIRLVPILLFHNLNIDVNIEAVEVLIMEYDRNKSRADQEDHGLTYSWRDNPHLERACAS